VNSLAVVHLARGSNGMVPLSCFLESYSRHTAGAGHSLYIAFKGYDGNDAELESSEAAAKAVGANPIRLARDDLMDVGAYREAAQKIDATWLVFLNSFTTIVADGWLGKLHDAIQQNGIGLAGATGSWESQATNAFRLIGELRRPRDVARWLYKLWYSPSFPNCHVRTNGFIIRRDLFLRLAIPDTRRKQLAYAFESGRNSMTRQVHAAGLKAVVVGRIGIFEHAEWPVSTTYCSGDQGNLLLEDNRSREYAGMSQEARRKKAFFAWGDVCFAN